MVAFLKPSQIGLERVVRQAWHLMETPEWWLDQVELTIRIVTICAMIEAKPDILQGQRLKHSLGHNQLDWVNDLYQAYTTYRQRGEL